MELTQKLKLKGFQSYQLIFKSILHLELSFKKNLFPKKQVESVIIQINQPSKTNEELF